MHFDITDTIIISIIALLLYGSKKLAEIGDKLKGNGPGGPASV